MNAVTLGTLVTVATIQLKGGSHYINASNTKMLELIGKYHEKFIKVRWYQKCAAWAEENGYLKRRFIRLQDENGFIYSKPSLLMVTVKSLNFLVKIGFLQFKILLKPMIAWLHRNDNRFPRPSDIFPGEEITERSVALARLKELIKPIVSKQVGG
jgi:hypothetical protein